MAKRIHIEGLKIEIPVGQDTGIAEITLDWESEFHGIYVYPQNAKFGDQGNLEIVHPTLGVVANYANHAYISPNVGAITVSVSDKDDPAIVAPGLTYRFTYHAVDTEGRRCIVWLRLKK
jgi:hypothetical protein